MINAEYFVVFIVVMQPTCNIFHQCTNILDNPRHMRRHYERTSAWSVVIVYRLSPFYISFVSFINQSSWQWTGPACHLQFFVGICRYFTDTCAQFNDDPYFKTLSDWHFHVMTVLTTTRKYLFVLDNPRMGQTGLKLCSGNHLKFKVIVTLTLDLVTPKSKGVFCPIWTIILWSLNTVGQMELKLCSGYHIANGRTDRRTDARGYIIICPKLFRAYKKGSNYAKNSRFCVSNAVEK
jgi:hypothetical protein